MEHMSILFPARLWGRGGVAEDEGMYVAMVVTSKSQSQGSLSKSMIGVVENVKMEGNAGA